MPTGRTAVGKAAVCVGQPISREVSSHDLSVGTAAVNCAGGRAEAAMEDATVERMAGCAELVG